MRKMICLAISLFVVALFAGPVLAQDFYIYPDKGQSQDQLEKDKFECYSWAKQNTGFDPMQTPQASAPPPQPEARQGGLIRGGARGAAVGAVGGAIAGNAGKGAAIGAATGALIGGMRRHDQKRREEQAQEQWAQQQAAQYSQQRSNYNRAFAACLEGRGYTVK